MSPAELSTASSKWVNEALRTRLPTIAVTSIYIPSVLDLCLYNKVRGNKKADYIVISIGTAYHAEEMIIVNIMSSCREKSDIILNSDRYRAEIN